MQNNERLNVILNPLAPKGELPFVRFAPGNGWSVQTATIKGCHLPDLAEAVADFNRNVTRKLEGLNVAKVEPATVSVMELPGWGDAVRDEMNARYSERHACPHGNAMLAVPRTLGDQWAAQLVDNIKADNVPAVRVMLETAGLMK